MDLNLWSIFALLLVSVGAVRFDLGPQKFSDSASPSTLEETTNGANEIVLYLTPEQIKALEASGAVVRPDESENDSESAEPIEENDNSSASLDAEPNTDSNENEQNESENTENDQEEEPEQSEEPVPETIIEDLNGDIDFEEIFRILNEEQLEEEEEEARPEEPRQAPQVVENVDEEPREIPARFLVREKQQQQKQREDRYLVPADKKARSRTFSSIRYQQEEPAQKPKAQLISQVQEPQEIVVQQSQEAELIKSTPIPLRRFRLVPFELAEKIEEPAQEQPIFEQQELQTEEQEEPKPSEEVNAEEDELEKLSALFAPLANPDKFTKVIGQRKSKLYQNEIELKAALRDLKLSPRTNDQKYAVEIERLKTNLEKQNTLSKAEALAKAAPHLIKKEILKRRQSNPAKQIKSAAATEIQKSKTIKTLPVAVENVKPVPVPKKQEKKVETEKTVPSEAEKRAPTPTTRNVYVKVSKPYERIVPVEIREGVSEIPTRKNEKITILRHIWEH